VRWRGPCLVLQVKMPGTVWCSYRGALIKTSPENTRRETPEERLAEDLPEEARTPGSRPAPSLRGSRTFFDNTGTPAPPPGEAEVPASLGGQSRGPGRERGEGSAQRGPAEQEEPVEPAAARRDEAEEELGGAARDEPAEGGEPRRGVRRVLSPGPPGNEPKESPPTSGREAEEGIAHHDAEAAPDPSSLPFEAKRRKFEEGGAATSTFAGRPSATEAEEAEKSRRQADLLDGFPSSRSFGAELRQARWKGESLWAPVLDDLLEVLSDRATAGEAQGGPLEAAGSSGAALVHGGYEEGVGQHHRPGSDRGGGGG